MLGKPVPNPPQARLPNGNAAAPMSNVQTPRSPLQSPGLIEKPAKLPVGRARLMAFVVDKYSEVSLHSCLAQLSVADVTVKRGGIAKAI